MRCILFLNRRTVSLLESIVDDVRVLQLPHFLRIVLSNIFAASNWIEMLLRKLMDEVKLILTKKSSCRFDVIVLGFVS